MYINHGLTVDGGGLLPTELDWRSESGRPTAGMIMTVITYGYLKSSI